MLSNTGASIRMLMPDGTLVQEVAYKCADVSIGKAVVF